MQRHQLTPEQVFTGSGDSRRFFTIREHETYRRVAQDHYIGIDVGTGSARACIIDSTGDIKALAAQNIKLWTPASGLEGSQYVCRPKRGTAASPQFGH